MNDIWDNWFVPLTTTFALHGIIIYLIYVGISFNHIEIVPSKIPDYVKASLVELPKAKPKKQQAKPKAIVKPVVETLSTPEALPDIGNYDEPKPVDVVSKESEDIEQDDIVDINSFLEALAEEDSLLQEESDLDIVAKYQVLIKANIQSKWSRPPSARNGMKVQLAIQLVPSGEVVSVTVTNGSGNELFDRYAVNAVWAVERFSGLAEMETRLFEEYFRELNLLFKPEDLLL